MYPNLAACSISHWITCAKYIMSLKLILQRSQKYHVGPIIFFAQLKSTSFLQLLKIKNTWGQGYGGKLDESGQKLQTSSYKINDVMYNMILINKLTLLYIIYESC